MDFALSEEQEMLKKMAREFLERACTESLVREVERGDKGYSPELWRKIAELGWTGMVFPEKYGGTESSLLDMAVLYEEMGRAMFASPHLSTVILCGLLILETGSEQQKAELLPKIAKGDLVLALALTELDPSWDASGVTTRATPNKGAYIISGTKLFVHDAHVADRLLCVTRTRDSAEPADGVTLFLVDARSPGLSYTLLKTMVGDNKQCEVVFDKVRVPAENMVGQLHKGWAPAASAIQRGAVMLCAEMAGAGQRVLELTLDYAKTRVQFDQPIGVHQHVQEHCIQLLASVDSSRWVTYQAAWKLSQDLPGDMEVAMAKAWTNEANEHACWRAHQVFGGVGYTSEIGVLPIYSRRGRAAQSYLGDTAYWRKKVAGGIDGWVLEMPKGKPMGFWQ
ncbi:MAG: acyl-CoA/acyl-ACP dehydrogenase [Chloroflexi bacterium]|nr:acyl-CoA/acyl-ACP dehydrogenase [Chloroflexota bacterium]